MRPREQRGYILIYVLGIMMILGGLALSIAYRQRIGLQLVHNVTDTAQDEWALRGAQAYLLGQLGLAARLDAKAQVLDPSIAELPRWEAGHGYALRVGERDVEITLTARPPQPDFNLLGEEELVRLFVALGAPEPAAKEYTAIIGAAKPQLGFAKREDLLALEGIPAAFLGGPESQAEGNTLYSLARIGSGSRYIDLDLTPLPLIQALSGLSKDKIATLGKLRASGPVKKEQALAEVGQELAPLIVPAVIITAELRIKDSNTWAELTLLRENNSINWTSSPLELKYQERNKDRPDDGNLSASGEQGKTDS